MRPTTYQPALPRFGVRQPRATVLSGTTESASTSAAGSAVLWVFAAILIVIHLARPFDVILVGLHIPLVLCGLAVVAVVLCGGMKSLASGPGRVIAASGVWTVLILPFSIWKGGSIDYLKTYVLLMMVLYAAVASGPKTIGGLKKLMRFLGLTVSAAVVVFSVLGRSANSTTAVGDYRSGGVGMYGNEGEFALLIGFILPFWVFTASSIGNRFMRLTLMWGGALFLFSLLVLTGTRSAFFALAPALVLLFARVGVVQKLTLVVAGLVLAAGIVAIAPHKTIQRLTTMGLDEDASASEDTSRNGEAIASAQERRELLMDALRTVASKPLFGVGPGNFGMYRYNFLGNGTHKRWFPAHNTYAQIAAECGVAGGVLYIALIASIFLTTRKALRRFVPGSPNFEPASGIALCIQVSLVFYAVMAAFQNCEGYPHVFVLAGLAWAFERTAGGAASVPFPNGQAPPPPLRVGAAWNPTAGIRDVQRPLSPRLLDSQTFRR